MNLQRIISSTQLYLFLYLIVLIAYNVTVLIDSHGVVKLHYIPVRDELVNTAEHLAEKETDVSLRRWWRPETERKDRILDLNSSGDTNDDNAVL